MLAQCVVAPHTRAPSPFFGWAIGVRYSKVTQSINLQSNRTPAHAVRSLGSRRARASAVTGRLLTPPTRTPAPPPAACGGPQQRVKHLQSIVAAPAHASTYTALHSGRTRCCTIMRPTRPRSQEPTMQRARWPFCSTRTESTRHSQQLLLPQCCQERDDIQTAGAWHSHKPPRRTHLLASSSEATHLTWVIRTIAITRRARHNLSSPLQDGARRDTIPMASLGILASCAPPLSRPYLTGRARCSCIPPRAR